MKSVTYVCYYDVPENAGERRVYTAAAASQVDYITSVLRRLGYEVTILSPSQTRDSRRYPEKRVELIDGVTLHLLSTMPWGGLLRRAVRRIHGSVQLLAYLLTRVGRDGLVLVYHAPSYAGVIGLGRRLAGFTLLLEVGEVYADVRGEAKMRRLEQRIFSQADAFLLSTDALSAAVNLARKPQAVIHGSYALSPDPVARCDQRAGTIDLVYAGTLDPIKGGAQRAVSIAEFLDEKYHIHIIGFGSASDIESLSREIARVSNAGGARVTYDGSLSGREYERFLQQCDVGLSTQSASAAFSDTSFPSKVLSYLGNGLHVVSVPLKVLNESRVGDLINFSVDDSPWGIACAVRGLNLDMPFEGRNRVAELDQRCLTEVAGLLAEVSSLVDDSLDVGGRPTRGQFE